MLLKQTALRLFTLAFMLGCEGSTKPTIPHTWPFIAAGAYATCGLDVSGTGYCWGDNRFGILGMGTDTAMQILPTLVNSNVHFASVTLGDLQYACALGTDGAPYCWGSNPVGNLGDGTDSSSFTPVAVKTSLRFVTLDAGQFHTCALTASGEAYCWGRNDAGQLGINSDSAESRVPAAVVEGLRFKSISAGVESTCGVAQDGKGWCWGYNGNGELGDSLYFYILFPTPVEGNLAFQSISVGWNHSCGVDLGGAGHCWGLGTGGELGNDSLDTFLTPQPVVGGHSFTFIGAGDRYSCGLVTDQTVWCWGQGFGGELGSDSTFSAVPIPISGGLHFTSLSVGQHYACGLAKDHLAYCWGANGSGQLGNGSTTPSFAPTPVGAPLE